MGRIQHLEETVMALQDEVTSLREDRETTRAQLSSVQETVSGLEGASSRVKLGGYGSLRFDNSTASDAQSTFTLRRLVLTTAAEIAPQIHFYSELEYERFRKLELERTADPDSGGLLVEQAIEGTDGSELALEQVWVQYDLGAALGIRAGGVLVPLGRFNTNHDDNLWNLTRRSLVDTGAPVLPAAAAWDELGVGLVGSTSVGEGRLGYELYVVNGVTLAPEIEEIVHTRDPARDKLELEAKFTPQTGTFSNDQKEAKALAGRMVYEPVAGQELAVSFYRGRYTPDYLADESLWALAFDGIARFGGFEMEGEYVFTRFEDARGVAQSFAEVALQKESNNLPADDPTLEPEIEFEVDDLADAKHGYWIELRRPFWPSALASSALGRTFPSATFVPVLRWEQVFFLDRLVELDFAGRVLTDYQTENRTLSRGTLGLAFRPTPLVGITLAYEYLFADGDSLDGLTNFLPSGISEDAVHVWSLGATFGF